jgi:hypothetical protein
MLAVYTQIKKAAAGQLADSPRNRLADRLQLLSKFESTVTAAPDRGNDAKVTF